MGKFKHGYRHTPTYKSWAHMKERCTNKKCRLFATYGGAGITLCKRWYSFENFLKDMGERLPNTSIDRIDNNKGYYKKNCRWATKTQQAQNRSSTYLVTWKGQTHCIKQWSRILDIKYETLLYRLNPKRNGVQNRQAWPLEKALTK